MICFIKNANFILQHHSECQNLLWKRFLTFQSMSDIFLKKKYKFEEQQQQQQQQQRGERINETFLAVSESLDWAIELLTKIQSCFSLLLTQSPLSVCCCRISTTRTHTRTHTHKHAHMHTHTHTHAPSTF